MIAVLAGGVGAARLLSGFQHAGLADDVRAIVNTGDDLVVHTLHVSPDIDTIIYTLSGAGDRERGWGQAGETWNAIDALGRFGVENWFRLGDKDLATHLYRSERLSEGATLTEVTAEIARAFGLHIKILPMSDDPVRTRIELLDGSDVSFQEYFVKLAHNVAVRNVRFDGAEHAHVGPSVLETLSSAERIVIAPSNTILSIGPILALAEVSKALAARRADVVAVSPIVGGVALKGPADRLLVELGHESSVVGVARLLQPIAATLVIDDIDVARRAEVEELMACRVTNTVMSSPEIAADLANFVRSPPGS